MRIRQLPALSIVMFIIAAAQGTTAQTANAATEKIPLEHFKFWRVAGNASAREVRLRGQFDPGRWWRATTTHAQYLGNPTSKTHDGKGTKVDNTELHYVAYGLRAELRQRRRTVTFVNQFTTAAGARWTLSQPSLLLVPAGKKPDPGQPNKPDQGDHFVCYSVERGVQAGVALSLEDQFDLLWNSVEQIRALTPAYFCVPVMKKYLDAPEQPLLDDKTHLAIYTISPQENPRTPLTVNTADQFGPLQLRVIDSYMLAVPSIKNRWR